jgi:hypothetical protein
MMVGANFQRQCKYNDDLCRGVLCRHSSRISRRARRAVRSGLPCVLADLYSCLARVRLHRSLAGNVQFDDPLLAYFCAESMIKGMEEQGVDHQRLLQLYINTYNEVIKKRPADMNVGVHLCRGNFKDGRHFSEGGYDRIAAKLFNELNADCYYVSPPPSHPISLCSYW